MMMIMTQQQKHRTYDEQSRQILNFLFQNGPSSILQIEYAVEINTRQSKTLIPSLISANVVSVLLPEHKEFKKAKQRTNAVSRLFKITTKGKKCMDLMNKMAEDLNIPVNVQYNVRRTGYFLPSAKETIPKTQGKVYENVDVT